MGPGATQWGNRGPLVASECDELCPSETPALAHKSRVKPCCWAIFFKRKLEPNKAKRSDGKLTHLNTCKLVPCRVLRHYCVSPWQQNLCGPTDATPAQREPLQRQPWQGNLSVCGSLGGKQGRKARGGCWRIGPADLTYLELELRSAFFFIPLPGTICSLSWLLLLVP